ncbi:alcohol dehydrogenase catalytic domain-containing protein [Pseudoclavibacter chungangensis]|uniref:Alcohol dehydrogenase catalytic domain-containing protein n=1 Tax=Pseudoclavibacter chungangensis TaxID=587635 RepID=A0A7J5BQ38_9MICO|nr:alcohol dehydrogenase catalytic domain-containing protein [Pseudoclavibacter chungangensis]KAB1655658.1 alcohol dehydrogenase catalytic domain-containing protein [Pseudoclavibacter chungangensis]NYJ67937.1 threonine dehydrogenase-like Zn-dependent dehydrogenase [Pseudoclavibacter chungangensis]
MTTAHQVVFVAPGRMEVQEHPVPSIGPDDLTMRVRRVGICATDVHLLDGHLGDPFPVVPGHEFVGEVDRIGADAALARGLRPGDRIAVEMLVPCGRCDRCRQGRYNVCEDDDRAAGGRGRQYGVNMGGDRAPGFWGGYAETLFVPGEAIVHRIPSHVDWDAAALVEPLAVASRCVRRGRVGPGDRVAIIGPGPIGLLAAAAARAAGADEVVLLGTRASRLELGLSFGADDTIDTSAETDVVAALRSTLGGRTADVVIETAGSAEAQVQAVRLTRRGGRTVLAGALGSGRPVTFRQDEDILVREVEIVASFLSAGGYEPALALLARGDFPFARLVSHRFPLERAAEALELVRHKRDGVIKALLVPQRAG